MPAPLGADLGLEEEEVVYESADCPLSVFLGGWLVLTAQRCCAAAVLRSVSWMARATPAIVMSS